MNAERKLVAVVAAMLAAAPLYAQVDLNQGSLKSFFKDALSQTSVATPASAPAQNAAAAPQRLQAKPVGDAVIDAADGDRIDGFELVSLRQQRENSQDPTECGWTNDGPLPCPAVFHPILKDGDAIGVEYSNCERSPNADSSGDCKSILFTLPELQVRGDSITLNGEVVAALKGRFTKHLQLVNGYRFSVEKTAAIVTRGGDYTYEECIPLNPNESPEPCEKTGRILHENDAHKVPVYRLAVSLTKI